MQHVKRPNQRSYYMLYVKRPNQRNCFLKKLPFFLGIFTNNIAELVVDNALCDEIFSKCFQLLFKFNQT